MIVYFDGDDTLWYTNVLYYDAYDRFAEWSVNLFGADPEEVVGLVKRKDLQRARQHGFHRTGFGVSMVTTYQELCARYEVTPSVDKALEVYMIGESVHDRIPTLDEAAVEVLIELSENFEVNILTLGDPVLQSSKLYLTGIYRHVAETRIVSAKNSDLYRDIAAQNPECTHVMVGNSRKADIGPALEAGWYAVWLETGSMWEWDDHDLEPDVDRLHVVSSLREVPPVIRTIPQEHEDMAV